MCRLLVLLILFLFQQPVFAKTAARASLESFSPQGSVKSVRQVTARFSAEMVALGDPRRPEPFDIDCPETGTRRWADPRTWVLDFDHNLPSGRICHFRLKSDLRSIDGSKVSGKTDFSFDTGGPTILRSLPEEGSHRVDERQAFVLALDGAVDPNSLKAHAHCEINGLSEQIGLDLLEGDARAQILKQRRALGYGYSHLLSPDEDAEAVMRFQGEALEQAEAGLLLIQCRRSLPPDTDVRLVWGKAILSPSGVTGQKDQVLSFRTRPAFSAHLRCQRVNPQADCLPMLPLELFFTADVPSTSLMAVRLVDETGKRYPAEPIDQAKTPVAHSLTFRGPFPEKSPLRIILPDNLRDDADRTLENAARFPLHVAIDEYPPLAKFSGDFGILERKTGGILPVTLRNLEPQIAGQQRVIEASDGVPGQVRRMESDEDIIRWLERVKQAGRSRGEWIIAKGANTDDKIWKEQTGSESIFGPSDPTTGITVPKPLGEKEFEVVGIPLVDPGFYVVELSSPKLGASVLGENKPRFVATSTLVTNLGVHFKWGREGSIVWVTTLDKATPVDNATIQISDYCTGHRLWQGKTGTDGLVRIPGGEMIGKPHGGEGCSEGSPHPLFVSARTGDDLGFTASFWNRGIQPAEFNLNVGDYVGPDIAHTVFDRALFRAGETVSMKHFFRRHALTGFAIPEGFQPNIIEITHSGSDHQFRMPVTMDARGIGETAWTIPKEARLGTYEVALTDDKQTRRFESGAFHVEQFRLPTMKAVIQPPKDDLINPTQVQLDLFLTYLSGGVAGQAPVKLRTITSPRDIRLNGYEDFVFGGETIQEGMTEEKEDSEAREGQKPAEVIPLMLDAKGAARTTLTVLPNHRPRDLLVEMEYQDANGEMEAVTRRLPLWPARLNIGLRTESWVASRDQVRFDAVVLDLRGKPIANHPVEVDLFERKTYSYRKRLIGGFYSYDNHSEVIRLPKHCKGKTDAMGRLHCEINPEMSGEILLQARTEDSQGNTVSSVTSSWLSGAEDTWFDGSGTDRIDLIPERKEYQPGETARFQVRMPFREATAWVTVEREGVAETFVTKLSGKSPMIEAPVRGTHAPNVFVSVLAIRGRVETNSPWWSAMADKLHLPWQAEAAPAPSALADLGKPAYRLGNAEIKVGWQAHRLDVSVEPAATTYKPRETAKVRIKVKPADGGRLPDDAELAIAAVDEALLELKPNLSWRLLDSMMNVRPIEVYTSTAQMQVIGKRHFGRKAVPHGGGGGRQAARELFDTLLLWKGRVPLQGRNAVEIDIPLNDALSGFRVVAVANAGSGLFGTGSGNFQTSQPLMLNSGLPPVVREGDRLSALFTLRNASNTAMQVEVTPTLSMDSTAVTLPQVNPIHLEIPAGSAREALFDVEVPIGIQRLHWDISAIDSQSQTRDQLKVQQAVQPAVPVRTLQATLEQVDETPLSLDIQAPAGSLPGRGRIEVGLRSRLAGAMSGVTDYMRQYPYNCLEQKVSVAIALRDKTRWADVLSQLPVSQDRDGLLRYFPSDQLMGSDVLTSYVLGVGHEAGWELPEKPRSRMLEGLKKFVAGRVIRDSALNAPDLTLRKLTAIEALARYGEATPDMLDSLTIDPNHWPTSAVLDWMSILDRMERAPLREQRQQQAEQILFSRLTYHGTTLLFSTESQDSLGWLMVSADVNAVRMVLAALKSPQWQADIPRLARGALGRQLKGRWNMTTANAWGVLAMEQFSERFESTPVTGTTHIRLGDQQTDLTWPASEPQQVGLSLPETRESLSIQQAGSGKPWAMVQVKAALPLTSPLNAGFKLKRSVLPVEQKTPGVWTRGDTARVTLELEAQSDLSWVVVDDPVPGGATLLGKGLGRDSSLLTQGERGPQGRAWLAYEERRQDAFRAYYQFVPKGSWTVEYTVRLNNPGRFVLPPTHVEALYAPEIFADYPNAPVEVLAP